MHRSWHQRENIGLTTFSECVAADAPPVLASRLHAVAATTPPIAKTDVALAAVEEGILGKRRCSYESRNKGEYTRRFEQSTEDTSSANLSARARVVF